MKKIVYRFIRFWVKLFYPRIRVVGEENLPEGPVVVVGNHAQMNAPISLHDAIGLCANIKDCIIKPTVDSCQGHGVRLISSRERATEAQKLKPERSSCGIYKGGGNSSK